jgi:transcriptional regulator with XRE-family HTH domain
MTLPVLLQAYKKISGGEPVFRIKIGSDAKRSDIPGRANSLSRSGLLLEGDFPFVVGSKLLIALNDRNRVPATIGWANYPYFGCHFDEAIPASVVEAVLGGTTAVPDIAPRSQSATTHVIVSFGANLRRLREARGISQRILAQKIGVSMPTISMWESDQRRPVLKRLNQICEILGVSAGELMAGAESAELAGLLAQSREQIARFLGTSPDKVRIMIEI